jgi:hypothetical protein
LGFAPNLSLVVECAIRCRSRRGSVWGTTAPGTLVLPPFQGASRKVYDEEPEQGDDGEPYDDQQKLRDLRRQNQRSQKGGSNT